MAYVVTRRCRIGDWREPGEVLTSEDLRRRNVRHMEDISRVIRFDPSVPEPAVDAGGDKDGGAEKPKPSRRRGKAVDADGETAASPEDESSSED